MIRLVNQIVSVCAWLTNFEPALIPLPSDLSVEEEVDSYFETIEDSDYDADSELTDDDCESPEDTQETTPCTVDI